MQHATGSNAERARTTSTSGPSVASAGGPIDPIPLALPDDAQWLAPPICLLREQLEVFATTPRDIAEKRSGTKPLLGAVGLRCRHCVGEPTKAAGAVMFPMSTSHVHQAVRNYQRFHFFSCPKIPEDIKSKVRSYQPKQAQSRRNAKKYWVDSCRNVFGMVDVVDDGVDSGAGSGAAGEKKKKTTKEKKAKARRYIRFRDGWVFDPTSMTTPMGPTAAKENEGTGGQQQSMVQMPTSRPINGYARSSDESSDDLVATSMRPRTSSEDSDFTLSALDEFDRCFDEVLDINSDLALPTSRTTPNNSGTTDGNMRNNSASDPCSTGNTASLALMTRNQLLLACQTAFSLLQTSKKTNSCPSLVKFGHMLYSIFIGSDPPPDDMADQMELESSERSERGHTATIVEEALDSLACAALENDEISESNSLASSEQQKRQRRAAQTVLKRPACAPRMSVLESKIREADLPVQLALLISSLINADDVECTDRYQSIEDLEQDLLAMVVDPDRYLFDLPIQNQTGRLFDSTNEKMYGREAQKKQLAGPFQRAIKNGGPREAVYVSGAPGTGKSSLVYSQITSSMHSLNGRVISGKFDALRQRQPFEVICQALDDFCRSLSTPSDEGCLGLRASIANAIDAEGLDALSGIMPSLQGILPIEIVQQRRLSRRSTGVAGVNQLFYYLNLFIAAISTTATPIILFFDDLQWCDEAAFDIFARIILTRYLASFLFVGCYRDDEISELHPLKKHRQVLIEAGIFTSDISLGAFDKKETNEMISDLLHLPKRITCSLADCVTAKTSGNILFIKQFLLSLCDEGLLWYSANARRWYWDALGIQSKEVTESVADLLTSKMIRLDGRAQDLLKVISCLGFECRDSTLSKLSPFADNNIMEREMLLMILTSEGILSRVGNDTYKFPHDKVLQAAYQLIPPLDRAGLHLNIGRQLRDHRLAGEELDDMIFTIVDQLSRGIDLANDHNEEIEIARLCLIAGKKAMAKSSVAPALIYHLQGTALLHASDWNAHYDLSLELFTCCVEAQFVTSNYDGVHITQNAIDLHARCTYDKLPSFFILISTLSAQGRFEDAVDAGLAVLEQLGESVRKNVEETDMMVEFKEVKDLLDSFLRKEENTSINDIILRLPSIDSNPNVDRVTAKKKAAAMRLIAHLLRTSHQWNQFLQITLSLRAIQLALCHGLSQYSISSFATYGCMLARHKSIREARNFGKLSLELIERFDAMDEMPRVCVIVYQYIFPFVSPVQSLIPELRRSYEAAMRAGSIEIAMATGRSISRLLLSCDGVSNLEKASQEILEFTYQIKNHKEEIMGSCLPILQYFLILVNDGGEDPSILSGRVMNYEATLKEALSRGDSVSILEVNTIRLRLFYIFGKYIEAGALAKDILRLHKKCPTIAYQSEIGGDVLYYGLTAAVLGCSNPNEAKEWHHIAESALKKLSRLAEHSEWNFAHRVELLQAEIAYFVYYSSETAMKHYKAAIDLAGEHKFPGERALALERTAMFCEGTYQTVLAQEYYKAAERAYRDWGATRKADHIARSSMVVL